MAALKKKKKKKKEKKTVKISDFRIFIYSDRRKAELLYGIYRHSTAHFVFARKRAVQGQKFAEIYVQ